MIGIARHEVKPKVMAACEELKKAIASISYNIWEAQDALIQLNQYGVLVYDGISVADLETKLRQVEEAQDGLERGFGQELWTKR